MMYRFPYNGRWSVGEYTPADPGHFTGSFDLTVVGDSEVHNKAITVHTDDAKFIGDLITYLNRNN